MQLLKNIVRLNRWLIARLRTITFLVRRIWFICTCPKVKIAKNVLISDSVILKATDGGEIILSTGCKISRGVTIVAQGGRIVIEPNAFIGSWTFITAKVAIEIGADALIAERVTIRDQNHVIQGNLDTRIYASGFDSSPISISNNVWISAGAVILKGVSIGSGAVVAANAVVVSNVAENEIVGGVPAKQIGMRKNAAYES